MRTWHLMVMASAPLVALLPLWSEYYHGIPGIPGLILVLALVVVGLALVNPVIIGLSARHHRVASLSPILFSLLCSAGSIFWMGFVLAEFASALSQF